MGAIKLKRKSASLFRKYVTSFFLVELASLLVLGGVLLYFMSGFWEEEQEQSLLAYTGNIAEVYEAASADGSFFSEGLCYSLAGVSSAANADIFIADKDGSVIYCRHMANSSDGGAIASVCAEHSGMRLPGDIVSSVKEQGQIALVTDMEGIYNEECFVTATAVSSDAAAFAIQSKSRGIGTYLADFIQIYIMSLAIVLLITGLIVYVSTYNLTKPIRQMAKATKRYAKGDFSYRIEYEKKNTVREFDELAAALNAMADELEELEASRTNFVANVSHELKTPMTTIGGFIDGILDGTVDSEHERYYLKVVSEEVKRLSRLVVSMLNMSKMEAGELRINPMRFNLTQQLLGIFISFEQKISDGHISVKGLDRLANNYVEADFDMMNQVFYNLVDNAVKFVEDGGEIEVKMENDGEYVTTYIKNTGKGIDSEDIDHVFERFYKGDKSRSLDAKSTGLGLFIVKNIVGLHNGVINVSSTEGKYTEFAVKLKIKLIGV